MPGCVLNTTPSFSLRKSVSREGSNSFYMNLQLKIVMERRPNRSNLEKNLSYLLVKEVYTEAMSKFFLKKITRYSFFSYLLFLFPSLTKAILSLILSIYFSIPLNFLKFPFFLSIILRDHKPFKADLLSMCFLPTLIHKLVSSPRI